MYQCENYHLHSSTSPTVKFLDTQSRLQQPCDIQLFVNSCIFMADGQTNACCACRRCQQSMFAVPRKLSMQTFILSLLSFHLFSSCVGSRSRKHLFLRYARFPHHLATNTTGIASHANSHNCVMSIKYHPGQTCQTATQIWSWNTFRVRFPTEHWTRGTRSIQSIHRDRFAVSPGFLQTVNMLLQCCYNFTHRHETKL